MISAKSYFPENKKKESTFYITLDTALIIATDAITSKLSQLMKALIINLNTFRPSDNYLAIIITIIIAIVINVSNLAIIYVFFFN